MLGANNRIPLLLNISPVIRVRNSALIHIAIAAIAYALLIGNARILRMFVNATNLNALADAATRADGDMFVNANAITLKPIHRVLDRPSVIGILAIPIMFAPISALANNGARRVNCNYPMTLRRVIGDTRWIILTSDVRFVVRLQQATLLSQWIIGYPCAINPLLIRGMSLQISFRCAVGQMGAIILRSTETRWCGSLNSTAKH